MIRRNLLVLFCINMFLLCGCANFNKANRNLATVESEPQVQLNTFHWVTCHTHGSLNKACKEINLRNIEHITYNVDGTGEGTFAFGIAEGSLIKCDTPLEKGRQCNKSNKK